MITSGATADAQASAYVQSIIQQWRSGGAGSTQQALEARNDLRFNDHLILDLLYEEFCMRVEQGEHPDPSTYCEQFPTLRDSILDMMDVHVTMDGDSQIAKTFVPPRVQWPKAGEEYRGYRIQSCLGSGAMAKVYLADHDELGSRHVALKVSRDMKEAATAGRLDHPNIMDVHWVEHDEARNATWMCMPFCGSATLHNVIARSFADGAAPQRANVLLDCARKTDATANATEVREPDASLKDGCFIEGCLYVGEQLADALRHAHERGILHRDLKPSNVLLTVSGAPKLLDFNLSSDPNVDVHRSGGTLGYMAPEHINSVFGFVSGDAHVDSRSEVYSLGVILYELMTGQLPFGRPETDEGPWAAAERMLSELSDTKIASPRHLNPAIGEDVEAVILRCLKLNPMERFETAAELRDALAACRKTLRTKEERKRKRGRHALEIFGGILAGLVLTGVVVTRVDSTSTSVDDRRSAAVYFAENEDYSGVAQALEVIPIDDRNVGDMEMLAYAYLREKQKGAASAIYFELIRKYPYEPDYKVNYAYIHYSTMPLRAKYQLDKALAINPNDPRAIRTYARLLQTCESRQIPYKQTPDEILAMIDSALKHKMDCNSLHMAGVTFATINGDAEKALEYAMHSIRLGQNPKAFYPDFYELLGEEGEAIRKLPQDRPLVRAEPDDFLAPPKRLRGQPLASL